MSRIEVVYSAKLSDLGLDCSRRSFLKTASALTVPILTPTVLFGALEQEAEAQWYKTLLQLAIVAGSAVVPLIIDKIKGIATPSVTDATVVPSLTAGRPAETFIAVPNPSNRTSSGDIKITLQAFNIKMRPGETVRDATRRSLSAVKSVVATGTANAAVSPGTIQVIKLESPVCSNVGICNINLQGGQNWVETNPFHVVPPR